MCTDDWIFEQRVMPHIDEITKHMTKYGEVSGIENGSSKFR